MFESLQVLSQWLAEYAEMLSGLAVWVALVGVGAICGYALAMRSEARGRRQVEALSRYVPAAGRAAIYSVRYQTECGRCRGSGLDPDGLETACHGCAGAGLVDVEPDDGRASMTVGGVPVRLAAGETARVQL